MVDAGVCSLNTGDEKPKVVTRVLQEIAAI